MKNEGKNAKHGFKIMTAVITVCAVLCTVFSAMSLVLLYKDHIMLKKYGDFGVGKKIPPVNHLPLLNGQI